MGGQRFVFDLTHDRLGHATDLPFNLESIESVIELVGVGLPEAIDAQSSTPVYYLISDPLITEELQQQNATLALWKVLNDSANGGVVHLVNGSLSVGETLLPPTASLHYLLRHFLHRGHPVSHTVISDRPAGPPFADNFLDSFLDTHWPATVSSNEHLERLANLLADALHRVSHLFFSQ